MAQKRRPVKKTVKKPEPSKSEEGQAFDFGMKKQDDSNEHGKDNNNDNKDDEDDTKTISYKENTVAKAQSDSTVNGSSKEEEEEENMTLTDVLEGLETDSHIRRIAMYFNLKVKNIHRNNIETKSHMHQMRNTMSKINNDCLRMSNAIGNIERSMQEVKNVEGESIEDAKPGTVSSRTSEEKKRKWGVRVGVGVKGLKAKVTPKDQEESDEDSKPEALKKRSAKNRESTWGFPARKDNSTPTWGVPAQNSSGVSQERKDNSTWADPALYEIYSRKAIKKASDAVLRDYDQELNDQKLKANKKRKH